MRILGINELRFKNWQLQQLHKHNGAYYYAKEIEEIILPKIKADVFIVTAGATLYRPKDIPDGVIIVAHNNREVRACYNKFFRKNILWICSKQSTADSFNSYGEDAVYIPLSIDTKELEPYKVAKKTKDVAYVGNSWRFKAEYLASLPENIKQLSGLSRHDLLTEMAKYKRVIAEGRCIMEAQYLGAATEVPKYPNHTAEFVECLDSRDVIKQWRDVLTTASKSETRGGVIIKVVKTYDDLIDKKRYYPSSLLRVSRKRADELLNHKVKIVEKL